MVKSRLAGRGHIPQDLTLLLTQRSNDGQQALGKLAAGATLGPKAPLAPEHDGTEGPLRRIIRKVHVLLVHKGPQRWFVLQQRATQRRTLGVFTRRSFLQEGANLQLELRGIDTERGALQRAIPHPMLPMEELPRAHAQGLSQRGS